MNDNSNNQFDSAYLAARAEAPDIALQTAREDARKERVNSILESVSDNSERIVTPMSTRINEDTLFNDLQSNKYRNIQDEESRILNQERIAAESRDGAKDAISNYKDYLNTRYPVLIESVPKQSVQIKEKNIDSKIKARLKEIASETAKKVLIVGASVAIAAGAGKVVYDNLTTPEPVPTPKAPSEQEIEDARERAAQEDDPYEVVGYDQNGDPVVKQKVVSIHSYEGSYDNSDVRGARN